jgi:hypothetical protein
MRRGSYKRKAAITLIGAGLCAAALMVSTGAFGALRGVPDHPTKAPKDCQFPRVKPSRIVIACGDFAAYVNDLHWHHWGNGEARGHGKFRANSCDPSCVEGTFKTYPAKVKLLNPEHKKCNGRKVRLFTHMDMAFPKKQPPNAADLEHNDLFCNPHGTGGA